VLQPYKLLTGKPGKSVLDIATDAFIYKYDFRESMYWEATALARAWRNDEDGTIYRPTPKSNALYYMKQAMRYGDKDKAVKYMKEYFEIGGTALGMSMSFANMNPAYGMTSDKAEEKRNAFLESLSEVERKRWDIGVDYYDNVLNVDEMAAAVKGIDDSGKAVMVLEGWIRGE
jgi:hypothetical protein